MVNMAIMVTTIEAMVIMKWEMVATAELAIAAITHKVVDTITMVVIRIMETTKEEATILVSATTEIKDMAMTMVRIMAIVVVEATTIVEAHQQLTKMVSSSNIKTLIVSKWVSCLREDELMLSGVADEARAIS